jgi:hypothetical protein
MCWKVRVHMGKWRYEVHLKIECSIFSTKSECYWWELTLTILFCSKSVAVQICSLRSWTACVHEVEFASMSTTAIKFKLLSVLSYSTTCKCTYQLERWPSVRISALLFHVYCNWRTYPPYFVLIEAKLRRNGFHAQISIEIWFFLVSPPRCISHFLDTCWRFSAVLKAHHMVRK